MTAGLKRRDIKPCALCGEGVMHTGLPLCWRVTVQRFGIDVRAVQRQHGLELFLGNPAIANAMGPDEDLGVPLTGRGEFLLCEKCSDAPMLLARLLEKTPAVDE